MFVSKMASEWAYKLYLPGEVLLSGENSYAGEGRDRSENTCSDIDGLLKFGGALKQGTVTAIIRRSGSVVNKSDRQLEHSITIVPVRPTGQKR
jgi:hypothetical protein